MGDDTRAKLRRGLELLVRAAEGLPHQRIGVDDRPDLGYVSVTAAYRYETGSPVAPPLTTARQLALSVLVGDDAGAASALADFLLEAGVVPARAEPQVCSVCKGAGGFAEMDFLEFGGVGRVWKRCGACREEGP